jgi:hypothetical protein
VIKANNFFKFTKQNCYIGLIKFFISLSLEIGKLTPERYFKGRANLLIAYCVSISIYNMASVFTKGSQEPVRRQEKKQSKTVFLSRYQNMGKVR